MEKMNLNKFNENLKKSYELIPYIQGNRTAKVMVADAAVYSGIEKADLLSYILDSVAPHHSITDDEWKNIIQRADSYDYSVGRTINALVRTLKKKCSYEEIFNLAADCCGKNPVDMKNELYLDIMGWQSIVETILKKAEIEKVESPTARTRKKDSRCQAVIGEKDCVEKRWESMRECELDLGAGHGTASQCISGKIKSVKGWHIWKEGETPAVKEVALSHSRGKAIRQYGKDKDGHLVDNIWSSMTMATKETGISQSSISKALHGAYKSAGGYNWEYAETSPAA